MKMDKNLRVLVNQFRNLLNDLLEVNNFPHVILCCVIRDLSHIYCDRILSVLN